MYICQEKNYLPENSTHNINKCSLYRERMSEAGFIATAVAQ